MNLLPNSFCFGRSKFLLCLAMVASTLLSRTQKLAGSGKGSRALFSPTVYLEVSTLLTDRVAVSISPEPRLLDFKLANRFPGKHHSNYAGQ